MPTAITARWPLGRYLGHLPDGSPEAIPTFTRLYSALVNAAATGVTSRTAEDPDDAVPSAAVTALHWLEVHPPSGMRIPDHHSSTRLTATAFRKEGVFKKEGRALNYKVTGRSIGDESALADSVAWTWDDEFPQPIAEALDAMCADVGCLGEAPSTVVLELGDQVDPTHRVTPGRGMFNPGGADTDVVGPGRLQALTTQFRQAHPTKRPTVAADRPNTTAMPESERPIRDGILACRLHPLGVTTTASVPWSQALLLTIENGPRVEVENYVAFARSVHRALVARIGTGAPTMVTGKQLPGIPAPANHLAIHYLPPGTPVSSGSLENAHLLLLVPADASAEDIDDLWFALAQFTDLRTPLGRFTIDPSARILDGSAFWQSRPSGTVRQWRTSPAAVPERFTRGRGPTDLYAQTAAWSTTNTLRGLPGMEPPNSVRGRLAYLEERGWHLIDAHQYITARPEAFVHRTNGNMPVLPYAATLELGDLVPETAVLAIGQSRHLGGGLLIPTDKEVHGADA